jgi:hypothetical protein
MEGQKMENPGPLGGSAEANVQPPIALRPPMVVPLPAGERPSPMDEVDLVDVFAFFWKIRKYVISGAVLGAACTLAYAFLFVSPKYISKIPLSVDVKSLPAITDSKKLKETFLVVLSSLDGATAAFQSLLENSPQLAKNLQAMGVTVNQLVAAQVQTTSEAPPIVLSEVSGAGDFSVTLTLPERGLGVDVGKATLAGINAVVHYNNRRAVALKEESSRRTIEDAENNYKTTENQFSKARMERELDSNSLKLRLSQLEYRLLKLAKQNQIDVTPLLSGMTDTSLAKVSDLRKLIVSVTSDRSDSAQQWRPEEVKLNTDRVIRLLSALNEESKISKQNSEAAQKEIAILQDENTKNESLFSSIRAANQASLSNLFSAMEKRVLDIDRGANFLPQFTMNEKLLEDSVYTQSFERRGTTRRIATVIVGMVMGAIFGSLIGLILRFLRVNQVRLRNATTHSDD